MTNQPIRILLVDDHPIVRDGLRGQLESQADLLVVGEAASTNEALAVMNTTATDVVLTDLRMPGRSGIDLIRELATSHPHVHVLVLTTFDTDTEIADAVAAGAVGYLLKDARRETIYDALRGAMEGRSVFAPPVARRIRELRTHRATDPSLSPRELEVLILVASGATNRKIGDALYIGETTVKTHIQHILRKLDTPDRAAAVATAYERGLL